MQIRSIFIGLTFVFCYFKASAFWLLNFGTASTLSPGDWGFIGGTGGQYTLVYEQSNFTPSLAHAGIRIGLLNGLDIGYRLTALAMPYNSVGPTLGSAVDIKWRVTQANALWQFCVIAGVGYAYLNLLNKPRSAYAPGVAISLTHKIFDKDYITFNGRYVDTYFPIAAGGENANKLQAIGGSVGFKIPLGDVISLMPEAGLFNFQGKIANQTYNGFGFQYGAVLSVSFKSTKKEKQQQVNSTI